MQMIMWRTINVVTETYKELENAAGSISLKIITSKKETMVLMGLGGKQGGKYAYGETMNIVFYYLKEFVEELMYLAIL